MSVGSGPAIMLDLLSLVFVPYILENRFSVPTVASSIARREWDCSFVSEIWDHTGRGIHASLDAGGSFWVVDLSRGRLGAVDKLFFAELADKSLRLASKASSLV